MRIPRSTYRLQIRPSFTLFDAAELVPYLADLGVDWVYLSPILTAEEGSDHGYDVTDMSAIDPARGGAEGLQALSAAAHAAGMGVLVDIVPNHMGVATPARNRWWWSVLEQGRGSRYAEAFDIDWDAGNGKLLLPVLGDGDNELAELKLADGELHYYGHRFPVAAGTAAEGDSAQDVHGRQHYELVNWRRADNELNYRRFFGVNTLAGLRVEEPWVFDESHAEVKRWFDEGLVDGLRIDHPDGLADPKGYLDRLRKLTGGAYLLVEKILEPGEKLPADWETEGTTGYDALADVDRLFVDTAGRQALGDIVPTEPFEHMIHGTKRNIADQLLHSEVLRLVRLLPADSGLDAGTAADAFAELLACFPVYRSYLPQGAGYLADAVLAAKVRRPGLADALDLLHPLLNPLLDGGAEGRDDLGELAVRFQQTSGMVMAKGVEDTAFYRYPRLTSLNEVGADPAHFAVDPFELHSRLLRRQLEQPAAMTALTTHDTKRSEDTRARISVLAEIPDQWRDTFTQLSSLAPMGDPAVESLLWQAVIGAWPLSRDRAHAYAEKASREASTSTTWTEPDSGFEDRMHAAMDAAFDNPEVNTLITGLVEHIREAGYANALSAKLVQLTMPGVPDVYQGTEFWDRSLVDPDNRRDVDFARRRAVLAAMADGGSLPDVDEEGEAKLLLVARALQLKRTRPELFSAYLPVKAKGAAADHVFAFDRGGAVTAVTRLPLGLERAGGWKDTAVVLEPGSYRDAITGRIHESSGPVAAAELFGIYPAALLVREDKA